VNQPITVLGVNDHLELWNPDLWAQEQARWETQLSELAEQLSG
jgi:DNA-binding transcriptional regulator/RsmH inhibitor MraZ